MIFNPIEDFLIFGVIGFLFMKDFEIVWDKAKVCEEHFLLLLIRHIGHIDSRMDEVDASGFDLLKIAIDPSAAMAVTG